MNDLISRQAVIDALGDGAELLRRILDDMDVVGVEREKYEWGLGVIESYIYDMKELPSAERKTGKWINHRNDDGHNIADCNQCGNAIQWFDGDEIPRYCCMCGARMEGKKMRLIDADALNELLEHHERTLLYNVKHGNSNKSRDFIMGVEDGYYRVQSDIKWIPTVDAVEVVRCKDCRYYEIMQLKRDGTDDRRYKPSLCVLHNRNFDEDYFCADGERKSDE